MLRRYVSIQPLMLFQLAVSLLNVARAVSKHAIKAVFGNLLCTLNEHGAASEAELQPKQSSANDVVQSLKVLEIACALSLSLPSNTAGCWTQSISGRSDIVFRL